MNKPKKANKVGRPNFLYLWLVVLMTGILISLFHKRTPSSIRSPLPNSTNELSIASNLKKVVDGYLYSQNQSEWTIDEVPNKSTPELVMLCEQHRDRLIQSMNKWCPTNQVGLAIRTWVPHWGWAVASHVDDRNRTTMHVVIGGNELVMLVPRPVTTKGSVSFFCSKEQDGRIVFVEALKVPDQVFAAFILHEIGHAQQYWREGKVADSIYEVEMHTLSFDILNSYSGGGYEAAVNKIVEREIAGIAGDFKNVYRHFGKADIVELDQVIGATGIGKKALTSTIIQHLLSIGFRTVDRLGGGLAEKRSVYVWVTSLSK